MNLIVFPSLPCPRLARLVDGRKVRAVINSDMHKVFESENNEVLPVKHNYNCCGPYNIVVMSIENWENSLAKQNAKRVQHTKLGGDDQEDAD